MSSITLNITYSGLTKKFTTLKSTTISQLITQALVNFKISKDSYTGTLSYNGKPIDSSLPIRLTSLLNNSKLTLSISKLDLNYDINVKLLVDGISSIKKCNAGLTVRELLDLFEVDLSKESELRILDLKLNSADYDSVKLGSVVSKKLGSVVIRLSYLKSSSEKEKIQLEQQEAIKLQLEGERRRKLEEAERRRQEEEQKEKERKEKEKAEASLKEQKEKQENENTQSVEQMDIDEKIESQDHKLVDEYDISTPSKEATPSEPVYIEEPLAKTPQLYIPSNEKPTTYENPDEDYEMTLGQAKAYHNIIKASAIKKKRTSTPTQTSLPSKYLIRVKFPDSSILQINFLEDVHSIKFGQLIKRIDDLLYPHFIDSYNLKLGYPPFSPLTQSFNLNSQLLYDMPDFKSERITLIWELIKTDLNITGPFVRNEGDITVKTTTEMPERVLESVRGELPDDEEKKHIKEDGGDKAKKSPKFPKWLKFKK